MLIPPNLNLQFRIEKTCTLPNWYTENRLESIVWSESVVTMQYQSTGDQCVNQLEDGYRSYYPNLPFRIEKSCA